MEKTEKKCENMVTMKRTEFRPGPYRITKVRKGDTYDVIKVGSHEGPNCSTTCTEFLKPSTNLLEY